MKRHKHSVLTFFKTIKKKDNKPLKATSDRVLSKKDGSKSLSSVVDFAEILLTEDHVKLLR